MKKSTFYNFAGLNFVTASKREVIETLYLQSIIDSYQHISKKTGLENDIRDRFYWDLKKRNPITKDLIDRDILEIIQENPEMVSETEKSRVDLKFFMSHHKFEIECKRLFQQPSKNEAYINDGLVRFINLKYAEKNEYAGMIGFIVTGEVDKIQHELSNKVSDYHVDNTSKIKINKQLNWKNSFISNHIKNDNSKIKVYHLFFQFTDKE